MPPPNDRPAAPPPPVAGRRRLALRLGLLALRATLLVTPRPTVALLRRLFAAGGAATARGLAGHDPGGVATLRDERYGDGDDAVLDVHRPEAATEALPVVVWIHGGGWLGGSKEELGAYFRLVAARGFAVVAPRYPLAPSHPYPAALRELLRALAHVSAHAERLGVDAGRIVLAGDSAGAQLAAQIAAVATTPGYAEAVGVPATVEPARLRGVVLACGPYDLSLVNAGAPPARTLATAILWSYSGHRAFERDDAFARASVVHHVSEAFPPALVTTGNADPLRAHSVALAERLRSLGVDVETLFFADDHEPPLGHEYQFDLDTEAARAFLERLTAFLARRLAA